MQKHLERRVRRIFDTVDDPPDRIVLRNGDEPFLDPAFFYVTDLVSGLFEDSSAILAPDGDVELVVPPLEEDLARRTGLDLTVCEDRSAHDEVVAARLGDVGSVGVHEAMLPVRRYEALRHQLEGVPLVDVSDAVARARLVKDDVELERIDRAAEIASAVLAGLPDLLEPGVREHEVAAEIAYRMQRDGASGVAFETIAAFGPRSAEPHYSGADRPLEEGDLALLDFGAVYERYRSDVTRTFVLGEPTDRQLRMHDVVLEAQETAIDAIAPGVPMEDVHEAATRVIDATEFEGRFIHSTGHGLGLATHDGGALAEGRDEPLEAGMVFTVEPGVYLPGEGGVRIEDDVVVTDDGCRVLTSGSKGRDAFQLPG